MNATTRRDEQGNVIGVVGIGQDITARLAQEREYSKLIDTANAPIFGVDTLGVSVMSYTKFFFLLCWPDDCLILSFNLFGSWPAR